MKDKSVTRKTLPHVSNASGMTTWPWIALMLFALAILTLATSAKASQVESATQDFISDITLGITLDLDAGSTVYNYELVVVDPEGSEATVCDGESYYLKPLTTCKHFAGIQFIAQTGDLPIPGLYSVKLKYRKGSGLDKLKLGVMYRTQTGMEAISHAFSVTEASPTGTVTEILAIDVSPSGDVTVTPL